MNKIKEATIKIEDVQGLTKQSKEIYIPNVKLSSIYSKSNRSNHFEYDSNNVDWEKLSDGLKKYQNIMSEFQKVDVSNDISFQKKFNGFYRIRQRTKEFYVALYDYLESHKNGDTSFQEVLYYLFEKLNRIEPSFSSKIAATINPNLPVWDSIVLNNLNLNKPGYHLSKAKRLEKTAELYFKIQSWYSNFLKTKEAKIMIADFDNRFPQANISTLKKIDLILWQTRV